MIHSPVFSQVKYAFLFVYARRQLLLLAIFFTSIAFSLIFLLYFQGIGPAEHATPGTDYLNAYKPLAESILQNKAIPVTDSLGRIIAPGYPVYLVFVFTIAGIFGIDGFLAIVLFNVLIAAASSVLLFLITEYIWGRRIALVAAVLWITYPIGLWFLKNPHTEIPFIFFLYGAILAFIVSMKHRSLAYVFLAGLLLGIASLIRPIALFLPVVFILAVFIMMAKKMWWRKFLFAGVLLISYILMLLPWELHVYNETGQVTPISGGPGSSIQDGLIFAVREGKTQIPVPDEVRDIMERIKTEDLNTKTEIIRFSFQELTQRPIPFIELLSLKAVRVWYATAQGWYEAKILMLQLLYLIPAVLGIVYVFRRYREKLAEALFLLVIITFFWFMAFVVLSILRYMVPVMGFVMIFSAIFLQGALLSIWNRVRSKKLSKIK